MDIIDALSAWDGKTTAALRVVADEFEADQGDGLLSVMRADDLRAARAASWVYKALAEKGQASAFPADVLQPGVHWEIALHLLQSLRLTVVTAPPELVVPWLDHTRPMLRAWALDAYIVLGGDRGAIARALADPAASVRARARRLA